MDMTQIEPVHTLGTGSRFEDGPGCDTPQRRLAERRLSAIAPKEHRRALLRRLRLLSSSRSATCAAATSSAWRPPSRPVTGRTGWLADLDCQIFPAGRRPSL